MRDEDLRSRFRRDFTKEVIGQANPRSPTSMPQEKMQAPKQAEDDDSDFPLPQPQISSTVEKRPAKARRRIDKRKLSLILVILCLIAAAAYGGYWYWSTKVKVPIPASIRSTVDFPLLYPSKLPAGYKINEGSFSTANSVVIFNAADNSSNKIAFTVQKRPANFDFGTFYKQSLANSTTFTTSLGQAAIGTANNQLLGSLTTDQSWLLVTSTSKNIGTPDLRTIIENIKIAPPPKRP